MRPVATGVGREHIELVWPWWWPLIKPAYERSDDKPAPQEILRQIKTNRLQCWAVFDNNAPCGGICTKLLRDTTSTHVECLLWLISGERLSSWAPDFLSKCIPWAKAEGASRLVAGGRKGWARVAKRYGFEPIEPRDGVPYWARAI